MKFSLWKIAIGLVVYSSGGFVLVMLTAFNVLSNGVYVGLTLSWCALWIAFVVGFIVHQVNKANARTTAPKPTTDIEAAEDRVDD